MGWREELGQIAKDNGGIEKLNVENIVDFAKNPSTDLHAHFEWNDSVGGHLHRLEQARHLLRIWVVKEDDDPVEHRVYVSLGSERGSYTYRKLVEVLSDEDMRGQLLEDALRELRSFQQKYRRLKELAVVFSAIDRVVKKR